MDFSEKEALQNFKFIYPDVGATIIGPNKDKTGYVVETDDGVFHTISDTEISEAFDTDFDAYHYSFGSAGTTDDSGVTDSKGRKPKFYCGEYPCYYDSREGYEIVTPNNTYSVLEGVSLGGKTTSDIMFIFTYGTEANDYDDTGLIAYLFGATFFETDEDYRNDIGKYISDYEKTGRRFV